jgi:phosphate transport system substrate-binding protein
MRQTATEKYTRRLLPVVLAAGLVLLAGCGATAAKTTKKKAGTLTPPAAQLTGAGSTFDQPFFTRAFYEYNLKYTNVTVNYASIGSGGGIEQFTANTVNFGASDVPMDAAEIALVTGGPMLQVPVALGGEAISYNLTGVAPGLHLTGAVLANIYLGKITKWDDPAIKALNPSVTLPNEAITVVHRADGSGTSYIFTNYLSTVSSAWANGPGTGKLVAWPVGVGGQGNEGVAGQVSEVPGAIGYVELAYAIQNNFTDAAVKNAAGKWVQPTLTSVAAAAAQKPAVTATDFPIVNEPGAGSYPISGYSWALLYQNQKSATTGTSLVDLFQWLTHSGQSQALVLDYVPLPANIQALAQSTLLKIDGPNGKALLKLTKKS